MRDHESGRRRSEPGELERRLGAEQAARLVAERTVGWFEQLRRAATEAVTNLSLDELLRDALSAVAGALGADSATVLIASDDGSELVARAAVGLTVEVELDIHIAAGQGFAGRILGSAEPLIVDDLDHFEVVSPVLRSSGLKSLVGVPLNVSGRTVGVMHAGSKQKARFTSSEVSLLGALAYPIAAAIERVRLFEGERQLREEAELTADRLFALQRITSALASARNVTEVCQTIVKYAVAGTTGASGEPGIWMLRDGRLLRVVGGPSSERYQELPLDESLPAASHLHGAGPLFVENREELIARWPVLEATTTRAFAGFPLVVAGRHVGVMAIGYYEDHGFDEGERAYLTAVGEQAGVALERAQAVETEAVAQERQAFLAETSIALTNRYASPEQLLETLAQLAVPRLADWCSVLLDREGRFEQVAVAHGLAALAPEVAGLAARLGDDEVAAVRAVLNTRAPVVLGAVGGPPLDPAAFGPLTTAIGMTSAILVPLKSHSRTVGVMAFAACGTHPAYRSEDVLVAIELAARAGRLVEDLAVRQRERGLAETLTRALLPARLPTPRGIELVARYLPAEAGPVGGDWYDAFELPDGRLGLVVGDVGGHGVEAASAMARLRNGLFAFASEGHDPVSAFERLSDLLANDSTDWNLPDPIASIFYASLDLATLDLHATCAGHPPWLLLRDGIAEMQECGGRVLAGSLPALPFETHHQLVAGDVCVFMTDGLVERPDEEMARSVRRLQDAAERHSGLSLDRLSDLLLEATMPPSGRRDDCCLLAVGILGDVEEAAA